MKWVVFFQTPYNTVKYMTDELATPSVMEYSKFLSFLFDLTVNDRISIREKLDQFKTILLFCETGYWEVRKTEEFNIETSFEELKSLNPTRAETKEKEKSTDAVLRAKRVLNKIVNLSANDKRNNFFRKDRKSI